MKSGIIMLLLLVANIIFAQIENEGTAAPERKAKEDTLITVTEEEIHQARQFGTKEKITSIVVGGFFGGVLGGFTASLFQKDERGLGNIAIGLYGAGIGLVTGAAANYIIIKHLAKKENEKTNIKKRDDDSLLKNDLNNNESKLGKKEVQNE